MPCETLVVIGTDWYCSCCTDMVQLRLTLFETTCQNRWSLVNLRKQRVAARHTDSNQHHTAATRTTTLFNNGNVDNNGNDTEPFSTNLLQNHRPTKAQKIRLVPTSESRNFPKFTEILPRSGENPPKMCGLKDNDMITKIPRKSADELFLVVQLLIHVGKHQT